MDINPRFGEISKLDAAKHCVLDSNLPFVTPRRGLVLAHNQRGQYLREKDLHRWAAYCGRVHHCPKMDVLAWGPIPKALLTTICYTREFDGVVSLRTDGSAPPDGLAALAEAGLNDVFLCPRSLDDPRWESWLSACSDNGLPVRMQLQLPRADVQYVRQHAPMWCDLGVCSLNVLLEDHFQPMPPCRTSDEGRKVLEFCNALAETLVTANIELNFVGLPAQLLADACRSYVVSKRHFQMDQYQYDRQAYRFARNLYSLNAVVARTLLLLALKRHTVVCNITDQWLTQMLFIYAQPIHKVSLCAAKFWRTWRGTKLSRATASNEEDVFQTPVLPTDASGEMKHAKRRLKVGGNAGKNTMPAPPDTLNQRPRYYDRYDCERIRRGELWHMLAEEAHECERHIDPSRVCNEEEWATYEAFVIPEYGATAWLTSLSGRRISTQIDILNPPFMVSVTVGGGLAELVGFQLTPACNILCPMVETRHKLTLYVREDGRYVLLRDDVPVEPVQIPGEYPPPHRVPSKMFLYFVAYDIEERISFSPLRLWRKVKSTPIAVSAPEYSIIVFCTRFARRLSAALACIAHQQEFDTAKLEVIVGYVPGLDATEDVLHSLHLSNPELNVIHATFPVQNMRSKGYVLNQCMAMSTGKRILLLDADTLIPPFMFATLDTVARDHKFIFPRGRAMVGPELTARILQGEIRPWEEWQTILQTTGDIRKDEALGVPIGYFQCFNRECLEKVRYPEYEHFQSADYEFAMALVEHYGKEYRLDFPVLHLDHQGSQWLGASRHF